MSVAHTGLKSSPESCAKNAAAHLGNGVNLGRVWPPEMRAKLSAAHMGLGHSPETRAKMSDHQSGVGNNNWQGGTTSACRKRTSDKRRALGFVPLNSFFVGSEAHHINKSDVIYIPKVMHKSVSHNVWTGKNMDKINALAGQYLMSGHA